jgi:hypothetical protein
VWAKLKLTSYMGFSPSVVGRGGRRWRDFLPQNAPYGGSSGGIVAVGLKRLFGFRD